MVDPIPSPRFFGPMLIVRNFAASVRFYSETVGLTGGGEPPYAEFATDEWSKLVLLDGAFWNSVGGHALSGGSDAARTGVVLAIKVPDVDAAHARLVLDRVPLLAPPVDRPQMGLRNLQLLDPDGNLVELYSDLARP